MRTVHPGIKYGNRNAISPGQLPDIRQVHGLQVPGVREFRVIRYVIAGFQELIFLAEFNVRVV